MSGDKPEKDDKVGVVPLKTPALDAALAAAEHEIIERMQLAGDFYQTAPRGPEDPEVVAVRNKYLREAALAFLAEFAPEALAPETQPTPDTPSEE